jgi:hypothetical protein
MAGEPALAREARLIVAGLMAAAEAVVKDRETLRRLCEAAAERLGGREV